MIIIWGTKVFRRTLGRIADYCPLCQTVSPYHVQEIKSVGHLYYIPLGFGTVQGHLKTCETCKTPLSLQGGDLDSISVQRRADLETLMEAAAPALRERWRQREALRTAALKGTSAEARRTSIAEALLLTNSMLTARTAQMRIDFTSALALTGAIFLPILWFVIGSNTGQSGELWTQIGIGLIITMVLLFFILVGTDGRRYKKKIIDPALYRSLGPLKPDADELASIIEDLRQSGYAIDKKFHPDRLAEALRHDPDMAF